MIRPMIHVPMDWDSFDELFVTMLVEGYETSYWALQDYKAHLREDPVKYGFMNEDYWNTIEVLHAFETLAKHYTARDEHVRMLADARDRVTMKGKIAKGMSQCM